MKYFCLLECLFTGTVFAQKNASISFEKWISLKTVGGPVISPDGKTIIYSKPTAESKQEKATKDRYGAFAAEGEEFHNNHLWVVPFHYDSIFMAGLLPCYTAKRGIPSKLIVYKGFGHGINKPKERQAAVWHNWPWFNEYIFGEKGESIPME